MDLNDVFSRILSFQTFSNLWYWLAVCTSWMIACYWVVGVPLDMIHRARRHGGQAAQDLEILVAVNVRRLQMFTQWDRIASVGFATFILTSVTVSAFFYEFEVAKGLFFILIPITIAMLVNIYAAEHLHDAPREGSALIKYLILVRLWIQVVAMVAIFISVTYGMFFNLTQPLGY
ncbi:MULTISPECIES: hypothetical protein [Rhodobacterales]|uniref:hypothetical protein n=1 Tax=Rhodobacterales TaxID=204455 RepID=UPI0011BF575E|nr:MULTISPECIES: hypothetical protein [Rhodobacterales]MDO6589469.1 hypothetical protein [Yoonia sp. 1_MG-2023]